MKVKISPYIFLFLIFFAITNQIKIYAIIMLFDFIHEIAHLCVGILLRFKIKEFSILPIGFCIRFENYNKEVNLVKKIIIDLAGPMINLIIFLLGILYKINTDILYANLLLAIFNLIPIYPLDGGRVLKNILKIRFKNIKAITYTNNVSNIIVIALTMISSILIFIYKNIAILIIIAWLWYLVIKENKRYKIYNKVYKMIDKNYNYL